MLLTKKEKSFITLAPGVSSMDPSKPLATEAHPNPSIPESAEESAATKGIFSMRINQLPVSAARCQFHQYFKSNFFI
jgi:hypothetical protein